ncbi:MAG: rhomboid family intramembrane serine protease [Halodesulfurarchaeum sp.]
MDVLVVTLQVAILVSLLASLLIVPRLDPVSSVGRHLRSRLLLGLPWGTLVVVSSLIAFFLFVQGAYWHPGEPLTIPFTSWSYRYPLGLLTAPFAHKSLSHLTGNVIGFLTVGSLAEYWFSHFPQGDGQSAFGDWRTNPYVRAFVLFPIGVAGLGLLTSVFAWGAIIGFSGVVFAAVGFAIVRFPIATVVVLVAREFVRTAIASLREPIVFASAGPSYYTPWWAGVAIQAHLLGFVLGAVLGAALIVHRRETDRPSAARLWIGTVVAGSSLTLWAIWWYRGTSSYVLYRGAGILLIVALGLLLAAIVWSSDSRIAGSVTRRQVGFALLALPLLTMAFVAVPINFSTIADDPVPGRPVEVESYTVTYAENVQNQRIPAIDIPYINASSSVNAGGVIVVNPDRQVWTEAISTSRLSQYGRGTVVVGGLTWRQSVAARRTGWRVAGGGTAYRVSLRPPGGTWQTAFQTHAVQAGPVIAGRNVSIRPGADDFYIRVSRGNRSIAQAPMPGRNESVVVGGLTFTRKTYIVTAIHDGTRIRLFKKEEYI